MSAATPSPEARQFFLGLSPNIMTPARLAHYEVTTPDGVRWAELSTGLGLDGAEIFGVSVARVEPGPWFRRYVESDQPFGSRLFQSREAADAYLAAGLTDE